MRLFCNDSHGKSCNICEEKQRRIDYLQSLIDRLLNANGIAGVVNPIAPQELKDLEENRKIEEEFEANGAEIFGEG